MPKDATAESTGQVEPAQSNRPEKTKFKQQNLDAWQPILTPAWVIGTFVLVGIVFVPVGAYLWNLSNGLFEAVITYDSFTSSEISSGVPSTCQILQINQGYSELGTSRTFTACNFTFEISEDIDASDQLYLYYQIDNFYQNHRRYVKSISDTQIAGTMSAINPVTQTSDSTLATSCDPSQSYQSSFMNRIFYPCGLIALSVFNDGISLLSYETGNGTVDTYSGGIPSASNTYDVGLDFSNVAWSSDLDNKYANPLGDKASCPSDNMVDPAGNACPVRYQQYQFLWQTYDQFKCYPKISGTNQPNVSAAPSPCMNWTSYINQIGLDYYGSNWVDLSVYGNGCAACEDGTNDMLVNAGGILPPSPNSSTTSDYGLRTPGFVVWMRTAGLPTFRKLFATVTPPSSTRGFKKGDKLTFSVIPNFLVYNISGSKALVLGTTSPLGGKNNILGIAYVTVGGICLFLAIVFLIKMKVHPRKLGDPQYLHWKKK